MDSLFSIGLTNAVIAALLAVGAAGVSRVTRRPALWYALWLVVLLRLLTPPLVDIVVALPELGTSTMVPGTPAVTVDASVVASAVAAPAPDPRQLAAVIWIAGALVVIGFAIAQSVRLRQVLVASKPAPPAIVNRVAELSRRLGLRRPPVTVQVADQVPPMLWAFLGSVRLILPTNLLSRLDATETDTLLAHELAHLRRRDHWVRHLELAVLAVFWWNPVAWLATRRVRRAQELCCDQRVAQLLPTRRRAYADTLVETARFLSGRRLPLASPARGMADLNEMKGRIQMIMTEAADARMSLAARLIAAAVLLVALAITPVINAGPEAQDAIGRPISLTLKDADLLDVLATFSEISAVEILVEPGISGSVTASFDQVPWDQALAKIIQSQGLVSQRQGDQIIVRRAQGEGTTPAPAADQRPGTRLAGKLDGDSVFRYVPDGRVSEPVALDKTPPEYPPEARKAGTTGAVVADLLIDEVGTVRDVVIQESPSDLLSAAAIEALEQWRFEPATMDGQPVAVRYIVTMMFRLQ